jgi:Helix-turn-helix domain
VLAEIALKYAWLELLASEHGPPNPCTRLVLFVLALHMKKNGADCFPSQSRIAKRTGLSERAVRNHLKLAARDGWLTVGKRERKGNKAWFVHQYTPTIPEANRVLVYRKPGNKVPSWLRQAAGDAGREIAEQGAPGAGRATEAPEQHEGLAPGAVTLSTSFLDARQDVPTNLPYNLFNEHPKDSAAAKRVTEGVVAKMNRKQPESEEIRKGRIAKAMAQLPDYTDAALAAAAGVTVEEVQRARMLA